MAASAAPAAVPAGSSVQSQLLANIDRQANLASQLFAVLSQESGSRTTAAGLPALYGALVEASDEQAELLEQARVHQHRWRRLEAKRARLEQLKKGVREVIVGLHDTAEELEVMVREGKKVVESIQTAEDADLQPAQITDYAQRLAPYTSRGPTWPPSYFFHTAEGSLYPSVYQMNIGKMRDAASGMLGGVGERGRLADQPGEGQDATMGHAVEGVKPTIGPAGAAGQPNVAALAAQPAPGPKAAQPAPRAKVPFKLDLDSDSEED